VTISVSIALLFPPSIAIVIAILLPVLLTTLHTAYETQRIPFIVDP